MLKIRFSKKGKSAQPFYRVIISENTKDTQAKYLELLGTYDPVTKQANLKTDRIKYWISVGAQPSNSVNNLLIKEEVIEGAKKKSVSISKKRSAKKEKTKEEKKDEKPAKVSPEASAKDEDPTAKTEKTVAPITAEKKEEPKEEKHTDQPETGSKKPTKTPAKDEKNKTEKTDDKKEETK